MKVLPLALDLTHEEQTMRDFKHEICRNQVVPVLPAAVGSSARRRSYRAS